MSLFHSAYVSLDRKSIGQHDPLEPLDRLVSIRVGNDDAHRRAAFRSQPVIVQFVAQDDRVFARRIFQDAADRQRALEPLSGIVIVVTVIENAAHVFDRTRQPDDVPQRNTFPQPHAQRLTDVRAGHDLQEPHGPAFGQLHQSGPIESRAARLRQRIVDARVAFRIGHDLELPGPRIEPDLPIVSPPRADLAGDLPG